MRCARNLTDACQKNEFAALFVLTKQIYGLCETHGTGNPRELFRSYRFLVFSLLQHNSEERVIGMMDTLVWDPSQKHLASLLNVSGCLWSSILTVRAPQR